MTQAELDKAVLETAVDAVEQGFACSLALREAVHARRAAMRPVGLKRRTEGERKAYLQGYASAFKSVRNYCDANWVALAAPDEEQP